MIRIDESECVGCGICHNICPEGIEISNGKAIIKDEKAGCIKQASIACPRKAIITDGFIPKNNPERHLPEGFGRGRVHGKGNGGRGRGMGRGRFI